MAEEKQEEHPPPDPVVLPDRPPIQRVQSVSDAFAGPVDVVSNSPKTRPPPPLDPQMRSGVGTDARAEMIPALPPRNSAATVTPRRVAKLACRPGPARPNQLASASLFARLPRGYGRNGTGRN